MVAAVRQRDRNGTGKGLDAAVNKGKKKRKRRLSKKSEGRGERPPRRLGSLHGEGIGALRQKKASKPGTNGGVP